MINNFEEYTHELTEYEEKTLLPVIVKGLKTKIGKENAVTNKEICAALKKLDLKVTDARIRKVISFIRINQIIKNLVSNSKGYFIATTKEQVLEYRKGLMQRIAAVTALYHSFSTP